MRTNLLFCSRFAIGISQFVVGAQLFAAPLTWFPGPALGDPVSGAATTVLSHKSNLIIGGDSLYGSVSYPESLAVTNQYWNFLPQMSGVRIAPGVLGGGDPIIVYGGNEGSNSTSTAIAYSQSGDSVPTVASMSVARADLGYAADRSGFGYAIGGVDDNGHALSSAERYNQDSDSWSAIASLPTALFHFPAVFDGTNYIYAFGGWTNTAPATETAAVLRYSVSGNSWTAMAPMPVAVAGSAAALAVDGKIYVVGGVSGGVTTSAVQVYDPAANTWAIWTPLPEGLSASAMGVDSLGRLIVMGGMDTNGNDVSDVWRSQQLGVPDSAPGFVSYPSLTATYQVPYASSINATGNPQPTYLLVSGPTGMEVDVYSGAITWTPQGVGQVGAIPVTIRATNYAGYADGNFTITVPNSRPPAPTNLYVASATEYSVTLAWDSEGPVYGVTNYSIYIPHASRGGVSYQFVGSTTNASITFSGLRPNTPYTYDVNAAGPGGKSGYSGIVATTEGPKPPLNLRVTGITSTTISLAWDPSPGPIPIARYEILGWIGGLFPTIEYGSNYLGTTATITGLTPGTYEEWTVRGYDAAGNVSGFAAGIYAVNPVASAATLSNAMVTANGGFQFSVTEGGTSLQTVLIQASANPADPSSWVQIGSVLPSPNPFTFADTNAAQYPSRFYRVVAQ